MLVIDRVFSQLWTLLYKQPQVLSAAYLDNYYRVGECNTMWTSRMQGYEAKELFLANYASGVISVCLRGFFAVHCG